MNVQPNHDEVDRIFEQYQKSGRPGCALAVVLDGEICYQQGYGLANLEMQVPVLPETVFNIGSMAKQFTAFAILLLAEEGRLSLDDDIRHHLPEMHDFDRTIAIHHLIHHTSGLRGTFPELLALAEWRDTDATTTDDVFWLLRRQRELNFRPGSEHLYANSGYVLLALICQRASGRSFADFCQERIFEPLWMSQTVINDNIYKLIPGRAQGYYGDDKGNWFNAPLTDAVIGPSNVYSSVVDLARWDENFYTGEVGGEAVLRQMERPGRLNDGTLLNYAGGLELGVDLVHRGWRLVEHGGGQGGYVSWMVRFPERHLSVVVLFNQFLWNMRDFALKVADVYLDDRHPVRPADPQTVAASAPSPPDHFPEVGGNDLEPYVGRYYSQELDIFWTMESDGDALTCRRRKYIDSRLRPLGEDAFQDDWGPLMGYPTTYKVVFERDSDGRVSGLRVTGTRVRHLHFRKIGV